MKPERARRLRRQHEESVERLRRTTTRPMAPRRTRTALAVAYLAVVTATAASPLLSGGIWASGAQLIGVLLVSALWVALRQATRLLTEAPEEALDELLVRLRTRCYQQAYQVLAALAAAAGALALILSGSGGGIPPDWATAVGLALFGAAMGLPLVVGAVTLPDADDDGDERP